MGWVCQKEPLGRIIGGFRILRQSKFRLFRQASKTAFQRIGFHPERAEVSLQVQLETLAGHDLNHLAQIQRLAAQHKARQWLQAAQKGRSVLWPVNPLASPASDGSLPRHPGSRCGT